jgi:hypothetical protein
MIWELTMSNNLDVTYIDPVKGGYIFADNELLKKDRAINKVNRLLKQPIGQDMANPTLGNPLLGVKTFLTVSEITNGIQSCLNPLISAGEINPVYVSNYTLTATKRQRVDIQITLPNGTVEPLQWTNK